MQLYKLEKIKNGKYFYRGHIITRHDGRGITRWRWVWEITDLIGGAVGHWSTLKMCKIDIDDYFKEGK